MNANKIYIVTSGCYSDYHIEAVFTTQDKANDYVQQNGTDYNIEEYELDKEVFKVEKLWRVEFTLNKDYGYDKRSSVAASALSNDTSYKYYEDTCGISQYTTWYVVSFYVSADSMDRAIKIASERFAAIKSNDYIWSRLTTPYTTDRFGLPLFERFNTKTNEFTK